MKKTLCFLLFLSAASGLFAQRVYGRYVPERKDDFAWENEYAAFRMYGPALASENPSNGVDLWLKASPELVVDSFYYRDLQCGLPYHINYGKGLDCYKVGHTMGCGGLAVVADGKTWVGGPYSRWSILRQTPCQLVFRLEYDSLRVGDLVLQEQITITCSAGSMLNKAEVVLTSRTGASVPSLLVGGGIYLHDSVGTLVQDVQRGMVVYSEPAVSDKQAAKMNREYRGQEVDLGRSHIAIIVPGATQYKVDQGSAMLLRPLQLGEPMTYYFGACWSMWHKAKQSYSTDQQWLQAIEKQLKRL